MTSAVLGAAALKEQLKEKIRAKANKEPESFEWRITYSEGIFDNSQTTHNTNRPRLDTPTANSFRDALQKIERHPARLPRTKKASVTIWAKDNNPPPDKRLERGRWVIMKHLNIGTILEILKQHEVGVSQEFRARIRDHSLLVKGRKIPSADLRTQPLSRSRRSNAFKSRR